LRISKLLLIGLLISTPSFADQVKVQVVIEDKVNGIDYRDAVYYPDMATYEAKVSDGSFQAERQARLDGFRSVLENPAPAVEITKEILEAQKAELQAQIASLDAEIATKGK